MNMKNLILILNVFIIIVSCNAPKSSQSSNYFWGEVIEENLYLYQSDSLTSIVDGEITPGSIILFGDVKGDFQEIYLDNPKGGLVMYRIYKPKFRKILLYTANSNYRERVLKAPIEANRSYTTGDRGGCYYVNSKGNKVYVNKDFCGNVEKTEITTPTYNSNNSNSKSTGGDINVKGYYRTTKSGKTIYVKPHTRKRS